VSLAWLLDGACDVVLFEAQARLGGHAHTVAVEHRGQVVQADLAAQFLSESLGPTFMRLLELIGVHDPAAPGGGGTVSHEMSITLSEHGVARPRFITPLFWRRTWPLFAAWNVAPSLAFFAFARAVRRFEQDGDWSVTLDEWLRSVPGLGSAARERVILPWICALSGCSIDQARTFSARAAVGPAARTLTDRIVASHSASHALIGLGGVIEQLARLSTTLRVRLNAAVLALDHTPDGPCVVTADGPGEPVEHVVLAAPPHALASIVGNDSDMRAPLQRFSWFRTRMVIHDQPTYMPEDRRMWSAYNPSITGGHCEASVWYGALNRTLPDGLLHTAEYKHPLHTPDYVRAQAEIAARQGRRNVWFAGSWTQDIDLQETALLSAMSLAQRLAPRARNLARLLAKTAG
jgi:predicted NAD/FAD-binding protein